MRFRIHTIEKTVFDDEVISITIPTESGEITVLDQHSPLVSVVKPGRILIRKKSGREEIVQFESDGFLEVQPEGRGVILLAS